MHYLRGCITIWYNRGLSLYEVRITRITPDVHPEQQVDVIIYI